MTHKNKDCEKKPKCQRGSVKLYKGAYNPTLWRNFFKNSRCPRHIIMKIQVKNTSCGTVPVTQVYSGGQKKEGIV